MNKTKPITTVETKDYHIFRLSEKGRIFCLIAAVFSLLSLIATIKNGISGNFNGGNFVTAIIFTVVFAGLYILICLWQGARIFGREWTVNVRNCFLFIECVHPVGETEGEFLMMYSCPSYEIECVDQIRPGFTTIWRRSEQGDVRILTMCPADIIMLALRDSAISGNTSKAWTSFHAQSQKEDLIE